MKQININLNGDPEDIFFAKVDIEKYLIDTKQISEKMKLNEFIEYIDMANTVYITTQNDVIPFSIITTDSTRYLFNVSTNTDELDILLSALDSIKYNLKSLKKQSITDVFNGSIVGKDYFIINKEYYIN